MLTCAQVSNMATPVSSKRPWSDISNNVEDNIHRSERPSTSYTYVLQVYMILKLNFVTSYKIDDLYCFPMWLLSHVLYRWT